MPTNANVVSGPIVNASISGVTQITSITTAVTLNEYLGVVTTVPATAGASGATPNVFIVNNSKVTASSVVVCCVMDWAGAGNPVAIVDNIQLGRFDINLSSISVAALNGVCKIAFQVLS